MGRFTSESLFGAAKQQIFYCCAIRDFVDSLTTSSPSYTLLQGSSFPEIKENSIFAVYDAAGLPVAASWAWGDTSAVLPEGGWLPLGLAALAAAVLCALLRRSAARPERKRRRVLLRAALIFGGAALGLLYTAGYRQVALAPVRALDGAL